MILPEHGAHVGAPVKPQFSFVAHAAGTGTRYCRARGRGGDLSRPAALAHAREARRGEGRDL